MTIETDVPTDVEIDLSKEDKKEEAVKTVEKEPELEQDDGAALLQQQLQQAQAATQAAQARAVEENRLRLQAQKQAFESTQGRAAAEYDAILNAIGQAEAEKVSARGDLKNAIEAQDADAMADAQERIATAQTYLTQLQDGKNAHEMRAEQYKQQVAAYQQQQPQRQPTTQEWIQNNPYLIPAEKEWLMQHPDALEVQVKNDKLKSAFWEAQEGNIKRGSKEYFAYMERKLGYTKRQPVVAAPPSRSDSGGIDGSRVTLTGAEREIAKLSNISEVEYARQKMNLVAAKKAGLIGN